MCYHTTIQCHCLLVLALSQCSVLHCIVVIVTNDCLSCEVFFVCFVEPMSLFAFDIMHQNYIVTDCFIHSLFVLDVICLFLFNFYLLLLL